ncbi:polyribonucleotide nucleotidyltransferase [Guggenheimella bovis]
MQEKVFLKQIAGRDLEIVVGKFATLTDATVLVTYADTQVLVSVVSADPREGIDFFPLSCEFQEKLYSVGRIPGGYLKREGRPTEKATLASRLMDRPIRPLFPKDYHNEVQIVAQVLSIDHEVSPEITAIIGASIALSISEKIPFEGPIGAVQMGYIDNEFVVNPSESQMEKSSLNLTVAGTKDAVMMVEAQVNILPEDVVLEAILKGHEEIKEIIQFIDEIVADLGIVKIPFVAPEKDQEMESFFRDRAYNEIDHILHTTTDKEDRQNQLDALQERIFEEYQEKYENLEEKINDINATWKSLEKESMRKMIMTEGRRPDGRKATEIRPISTEVGLIRRTHGSGYFVRGLTSALSLTTIGALRDAQRLDGIEEAETKRFMLHYNFPPLSVGETGPMRGPNRRAIGHGALGEKALLAVIPSEEEFPYTIRIVSEILSSNGSTSQASICAGSMSLMDAGVPIKAPVAGIAMGLIKEDERVEILSDIQGIEDFLGDMDFKVAGTKDGVTAIQMDIKIAGIDRTILERALKQAHDGRMHILSKMSEAISEPNELSPYAPRVILMWIHPDKIREVIGTGGKVIQKITADNNVEIEITDDGKVLIYSVDAEGGENAKKQIEAIVKDVEVGEIYDAKIVRIAKFGAFVALDDHHEALVHISELTHGRLEKVEDEFNEGDVIQVKIIGIDDEGKIKASRKVLLEDDIKKDRLKLMENIKVGDIFTAKILRIAKFGAFVELSEGVEALCHISELTMKRLNRVEDEFKVGDEIVVKVLHIEEDKIGVSRKALLQEAQNDSESHQ